MVSFLIKNPEQEADLGGRRPRRVFAQALYGPLQRRPDEQVQVLSEQGPHGLQGEPGYLIDRCRGSVHERLVDIRNGCGRGCRQFSVVLQEARLQRRGGQEQQCLVTLGQLLQRERGARGLGEAPGLPHFEAGKVADHHPSGSTDVGSFVGGLLPVPLDLLASSSQRLARGLHLHDAHPWPVQVHETG